MLRTRIAEHDDYQRHLAEQEEHARIGALLHAYEHQLALAKAKAGALRAQGTPNDELEDLIAQAEIKRAKTRRIAMQGVLQHHPDPALDEHHDAPQEPVVPRRQRKHSPPHRTHNPTRFPLLRP